MLWWLGGASAPGGGRPGSGSGRRRGLRSARARWERRDAARRYDFFLVPNMPSMRSVTMKPPTTLTVAIVIAMKPSTLPKTGKSVLAQ